MAEGGERPEEIIRTVEGGSDVYFDNYCNPCDEEGRHVDTVTFCKDCMEYLCEVCTTYHQKASTSRHHVILERSDILKDTTSSNTGVFQDRCVDTCPKHPDRIVKCYCYTHDTLACSECALADHKKCDKIDKKISFRDVVGHLKKLEREPHQSHQTSKDTSTIFVSKDNTGRKTKPAAKAGKSRLVKQVSALFRKKPNPSRSDKQTSRFAASSPQLSRFPDNPPQSSQFTASSPQLSRFRDNPPQSSQFIDNAPQPSRFTTSLPQPSRFTDNPPQTSRFTDNPPQTSRFTTSPQFATSSSGKAVQRHTNQITYARYLIDITVKCNVDNVECWVTGIAVLSGDKLIITDSNNKRVKVIDVEKRSLIHHVKLQSRPRDVTSMGDGKLAVTLPEDKAFQYMNVSTDGRISASKKITVNGECRGIAFSGDMIWLTFIYPARVEALTLDGKVQICLTQDVFQHPSYLAVSPDNDRTIYVSDYDSVICMSPTGQVLSVSKHEDLNSPAGIALAADGTVFVSSGEVYSREICRLTSRCELLGQFQVCEFIHGLAYSEDDRLYLGMSGNRIRVYQIEKYSR